MKKRGFKTRLDALIKLTSCDRSSRQGNSSRDEKRIYQGEDGLWYLTSQDKIKNVGKKKK